MYSNLPAALVIALCTLQLGTEASASSYSRTATSGRPEKMHAYHSWDSNCASLSANVNIVSKPAHGTLVPRVVPHTISVSRFGPVGRCAGKSIKALQIDYKSTPGYRGTDTFTIEVIFGFQGKRETDTYTVTVQ